MYMYDYTFCGLVEVKVDCRISDTALKKNLVVVTMGVVQMLGRGGADMGS